MSQDFETLNKQIAAFIIVSSAFAVPVCADGGLGGGNDIMPAAHQNMLVRYAGPGMDMPTPSVLPSTPDSPNNPMVVKYAGPGVIVPTPLEPKEPMVVKYAGPGINGEWPEPGTLKGSSLNDQMQQINSSEKLRMINSADSVTVNSSEEEHDYGEVKIAPGHFKFW